MWDSTAANGSKLQPLTGLPFLVKLIYMDKDIRDVVAQRMHGLQPKHALAYRQGGG